jgi:hypothetical protein
MKTKAMSSRRQRPEPDEQRPVSAFNEDRDGAGEDYCPFPTGRFGPAPAMLRLKVWFEPCLPGKLGCAGEILAPSIHRSLLRAPASHSKHHSLPARQRLKAASGS